MSCALATTRGLVCRCDPRACASCKSTEPTADKFRKQNDRWMQLALRRANKDSRVPSGPRR